MEDFQILMGGRTDRRIIYNSTDNYITVTAKAWRKLTPQEIAGGVHDRVEVYLSIGEVRGMTDNGQPAWTQWGNMHFQSEEEAKSYIPHMSLPYDCEELHDIKIIFRTDRTVKDRVEVEIKS